MMKPVIALLAVALLGLAACSGTPESAQESQQPTEEVSVSTPPDSPTASPTPTVDAGADFDTAVEFTTLTHDSEYAAANQLVKPESPAARYLAHQTLNQKATTIAGGGGYDDPIPVIKPDPKTKSIKVTFPAEEPMEGERAAKALTYTWKDFTFDQGKVTGWTGKSGPVKDVLWSRETSDESRGRTAVLKSAYKANNGNIVIIVELSSKVGTGWSSGEYAAKDGYRQVLLEEHINELSKGEKTLGSFVVEDAEFGGVLHIAYTDESGSSGGNGDPWELLLTIK